ncbi:MAG: hypothetical protein HY394_02525 [Candidatus Diapherotrites archaeon]|nr:hypothetical protein [Candidatus Diapherotrites archaeon]
MTSTPDETTTLEESRRVSELKHLSKEAFLIQITATEKKIQEALVAVKKLHANAEIILQGTALGKFGKLADKAFTVLQKNGQFSTNDASKFGVFGSRDLDKLFTEISKRYPEVRTQKTTLYGSNQKIRVAVIDVHEFEKAKSGPYNDIRNFVVEKNPTRDQLIEKFGWGEKVANDTIALLARKGMLCWSDGRYSWEDAQLV